jgi:hypothetical protein
LTAITLGPLTDDESAEGAEAAGTGVPAEADWGATRETETTLGPPLAEVEEEEGDDDDDETEVAGVVGVSSKAAGLCLASDEEEEGAEEAEEAEET